MAGTAVCAIESALLAGLVFTAAAEDYVAAANGVIRLQSPVHYDGLVVSADGREGKVQFDQRAYEKSPEYANSFTSLWMASFSVAEFVGGYWDFGAQNAAEKTQRNSHEEIATPKKKPPWKMRNTKPDASRKMSTSGVFLNLTL